MTATHRWKVVIDLEREDTGQWFASWKYQNLGELDVPAGISGYADSRSGAIAKALEVISNVLKEMT